MIPDISLETKLWEQGYIFVAGIDEAGRGPWAGPVTAGAVIINRDSELGSAVKDSKKMTKAHRDCSYQEIKDTALAWGIGEVSASEIDDWGISISVRRAMQKALSDAETMLKSKADYLIIDGANVMDIAGYPSFKVNKGDSRHYSIAAASVLAKVYRDNLMEEYALEYPEYSFENHVGYGTKAHRDALKKYGITPLHRKSFKPIAALL